MKKGLFKQAVLAAGLLASFWLSAEPKLLDQVEIRVNEGVVLSSEIDAMVRQIKGRAIADGRELPRDEVLRVQVSERLISSSLQLQMAEKMGLRITEEQLNQTLSNMASDEGMSLAEYRDKIEASGESFLSYRAQVRDELLLGEVARINVRNRISVSPQEIDNLATLLKEQGQNNIDVHFGHILIDVSSNAGKDEIADAESRALSIKQRIADGADFSQTATATSSGPKALEGGDWGWMNINEMPSMVAEVMQTAKTGDLIGPLRSGAGFHIIKVFDMRGVERVEVVETNARHILIKPSIILSESRAKGMLEEFAAEVKQDESRFAELAKEHSEDPGSASQGGNLGWSNPEVYVPEFRDALKRMQPGEISAPIRTTHGWHLVQLLDRRTLDATEKRWQERAYQLLMNRKYTEEASTWQRELRQDAYIEVVEHQG